MIMVVYCIVVGQLSGRPALVVTLSTSYLYSAFLFVIYLLYFLVFYVYSLYSPHIVISLMLLQPQNCRFFYSILMNCDSFKPFLGVRGWIFKDILPDLTLTGAECNVRRATFNNAAYRIIVSAQVILIITCVDLH